MYDHWTDIAPAAAASGSANLSQSDLQVLVTLLEELRELTQSRRSHAAASEYVRKLAGRA